MTSFSETDFIENRTGKLNLKLETSVTFYDLLTVNVLKKITKTKNDSRVPTDSVRVNVLNSYNKFEMSRPFRQRRG